MDNWHTAQCTKPDIAIFPGLNVPACMNCGGICPSDRADNKQNDELQIPSAGKRSAMQLNWPPSMSYQSYAYRDDPDGSLHKALASQVDQEWCDKEPGKHTPCSSIIKTAQTPSSQVSKTSYEPLDSTKIRVLRLYKGHFGDCLHGEFETISLQNQDAGPEEPEMISSDGMEHPTPYEAVSYTWAKGNGKREKDHAIFIGSRWDILPITENCFDALQNCRLDDQDRRLWVDAICINQSNISERTHQVGMMRYIYSTASRVLIYLGIGDSGSGSEITDDPEILSGNQYFSRIWVVQEIASAKQALVLYDRKAMHWGFFHGNLQRLSSKRWMQNFGSPRQIDDAHEFLTLLGDTRDCNASDPRDKIFALLGLWKKQVDPDYTLSPQAVYTGLASTLVTDERWEVVAQLLDMATHGRSMLGLPSWVPDWSEKSQQPYHRQWNSRFSLPVRSLSDGEWRFRIHRQTGSLCVLAAKIDILASYLSCGFRMTTNGMMIAKAGCVCVSLAPEVLSKCEPNDCILALSRHKFCLILRKKADPNIYTFIGLCEYSDLLNDRGLLIGRRHQPMELDAIRYLQDWAWLLSLEERPFWSEFATWEKTQIYVKRHIALSLGQGLENGLRQLQRLALEHFPQELLAHEKLVSYSLKTSYSLDFKEKEWAIFLHWLSRPISPSYDMLRHGLRMDAPLIWEVGLVAQTQLEEAHTWLDDNFDHHIETLYSSSSTEPSLDKFFKLIYREQFELLWLFVFRSYSTDSKRSHRVALDNIGAGFARAFFWRFDRSISKACQAVGVGLPTQQEIEKQWNRFLGWLRQQPFEEPVWDIPSEVYDERPRWLVEEERSGEYDRDYFLKKIKYDGLFMVPKTPESPQAWPKHVKSHARLQPQTFCGKQRLSELVHSEIQRRRLPERVFAFLFDDAEATPQPTTSECTGLEELLARDQLSICGGPFTQRWRQETESWKVVEQYISESQWHMSRMKMGLLCGSEKDGVMYKEIVVV
ncbi:hypothetical protein FocTR4_00011837 [Fusarium oxysporum f. sp. cubense]|uniref:Heterokaryon incompatibility domain-containing protein n=1 Tax=Fusarium oxysporum f. sp. cubense TaxID=61366 RepID=A0A5C6SHQ2_FUSOC|nr:hypothetical protein FocTR4_00011837 [Fusarium oxysporum f. sp. cubense]